MSKMGWPIATTTSSIFDVKTEHWMRLPIATKKHASKSSPRSILSLKVAVVFPSLAEATVDAGIHDALAFAL
jgi:hypothetical protein